MGLGVYSCCYYLDKHVLFSVDPPVKGVEVDLAMTLDLLEVPPHTQDAPTRKQGHRPGTTTRTILQQ